jgi:uncharacterized cofD-like protein
MPVNEPIKMVAIGGGTGLSTLLRGLKPRLMPSASGREPQRSPHVSLTAIVTVTDDGKSSGRLRGEFAVLPPGDIRNCLVALADEEQLMTQLFRHRFPGDGAIGGHSLGNLIILALNQMTGNFLEAVDQARQMLNVKARVLPSTLDRVDLVARIGNRNIRGQVAIKSRNAPIRELAITPSDARALPNAIEAILDADLITLGPGSLYTSVIANLLLEDIAHALLDSKAKKIYICNAMTEFDETNHFTAIDHVKVLLEYAPNLKLDYALFNSAPISAEMRQRYAAEKAMPLDPPLSTPPELAQIEFVAIPLISESRAVRHDPEKLTEAIFDVYYR